jgi:hypothetical protein
MNNRLTRLRQQSFVDFYSFRIGEKITDGIDVIDMLYMDDHLAMLPEMAQQQFRIIQCL